MAADLAAADSAEVALAEVDLAAVDSAAGAVDSEVGGVVVGVLAASVRSRPRQDNSTT